MRCQAEIIYKPRIVGQKMYARRPPASGAYNVCGGDLKFGFQEEWVDTGNSENSNGYFAKVLRWSCSRCQCPYHGVMNRFDSDDDLTPLVELLITAQIR